MSGGRVDQTSVAGVLLDHRKRIRALEATPAPAGLLYDFDNEGNWFYAAANVGEANRDADGTTVVSWEFSTGISSAPFLISGDGGFWVETAGEVLIHGGSTVILGNSMGWGGIAQAGSLEVSGTGRITAWIGTAASGQAFQVLDGAGAPIMSISVDAYVSFTAAGIIPNLPLAPGPAGTLWQNGTVVEVAP